MKAFLLFLGTLLLLSGCAVQKNVTITTRPPDALIKVNGAERGRGTVIERFTFRNPGDVFYVTASRKGYQDRTVTITRDNITESLLLEMKPQVRRISITTSPVPAIISIDGKPLTAEPASAVSADVEFTVDAEDEWITHTITAERQGFIKAEQVISWTDASPIYNLRLEPMRKDLKITTNPPGATVLIDGVEVGKSPVLDRQRPFDFDVTSGKWVDKTIRVIKPGYDPIERVISWDNGQTDYQINLIPKQKTVQLLIDPPDASVTIEGAKVRATPTGATADLVFTPVDDKGTLKTYQVTITKKTPEIEYYPTELTIGWDDGRTDYPVKLREVLSQPTEATTLDLIRQDGEWKLQAQKIRTISMKFVHEPEGDQPQQIVKLNPGQTIGSLSVSPDGKHIVYSVIEINSQGEPTSLMFRTRTDGQGGATALSDGRSIDLTPAYTAGGDRIVYSSNAAGRKLSIWSIDANGVGGPVRYTTGETNDLWPSVDAEPKPRLFYQAHVDTRSDPRLYMTQIGTSLQTDLARLGGLMPRVSPKGDSVLYVLPNERTGKRDIYRVGDKGGASEALTTGGSDNTDPTWDFSATRIAFASDRGQESEDGRHNFDIWVLELGSGATPRQVTRNGSVDDMPAFDPLTGDAIYFRSNRGGVWGIWKISLRSDR